MHLFWFLDQDVSDIMHCPLQELNARLKRAWYHKVGAQHAYCGGFSGLSQVDVPTSSRGNPHWSADEVGLLRVLQNGTFITHDQLCTAKQVDTDHCRLCGGTDSLHHRHWTCPATEHLRQDLPHNVMAQLPSLPACTLERGWFVEPREVREYKQSLHMVLLRLEWDSLHEVDSEVLDLFTDGSCLSPHIPVTRLCSRAVVQAIGHPDDHNFHTVAFGGLPGQWQTILRAEIQAVITAVSLARDQTKWTRIWCDNDTVVRRFRKLQNKKFRTMTYGMSWIRHCRVAVRFPSIK